MAHSFRATTTAYGVGVAARLMQLSEAYIFPNATQGMAVGSTVEVFVDMTTGYLMGACGATGPQANFIIWLEATGQYNNCF